MTDFRSVDALTGTKSEPSAFFRALSEADAFCSETTELESLRDRVAELEIRNGELRVDNEEFFKRNQLLEAEVRRLKRRGGW